MGDTHVAQGFLCQNCLVVRGVSAAHVIKRRCQILSDPMFSRSPPMVISSSLIERVLERSRTLQGHFAWSVAINELQEHKTFPPYKTVVNAFCLPASYQTMIKALHFELSPMKSQPRTKHHPDSSPPSSLCIPQQQDPDPPTHLLRHFPEPMPLHAAPLPHTFLRHPRSQHILPNAPDLDPTQLRITRSLHPVSPL